MLRKTKKSTKKLLEEIAELQAELYRPRGRRDDAKIKAEAIQVIVAAAKLLSQL